MGIFGENNTERELRQEIATLQQETGSLRQQLVFAQDTAARLREDNTQLYQHIATLQTEGELIKQRLRNAVNTAKRKTLNVQWQAAKVS